MDRVTVAQAARILGIKEESVRKRVSRGKLRSDKDEDGRLLVYVDGTQTVRDEYRDESHPESQMQGDALVEELRDRIAYLERQVGEERESRRRADTIIAQLTQANAALAARVPELEPAEGRSEGAEEPAAGVVRPNPSNASPGAQNGSERVSWWRRWFG